MCLEVLNNLTLKDVGVFTGIDVLIDVVLENKKPIRQGQILLLQRH